MAQRKIYRWRSEKSRPSGPEGKGEEREKDHIISPSSDTFYTVFHVGVVMGEALWSRGKGRAVYALVGRRGGTDTGTEIDNKDEAVTDE